jgi:2'-5' RNA ligase
VGILPNMPDKQLYLLAEFDSDSQAEFTRISETLFLSGFSGQQTKGIPYHFTLGNADVEFKPELISNVARLGAITPRVDVYFDHIGLFGLDVLFLAPNATNSMLDFRQAFFPDETTLDSKSADQKIALAPWSPHATLLIDEPARVAAAIPIVAENFCPFPARITQVSLYEFFPPRLYLRVPLPIE